MVLAVARTRAAVDRIVVLARELHRSRGGSRTSHNAAHRAERADASRSAAGHAGPHALDALHSSRIDDRLVSVEVDQLAEVDLSEVDAAGEHHLNSAVRALDAGRPQTVADLR